MEERRSNKNTCGDVFFDKKKNVEKVLYPIPCGSDSEETKELKIPYGKKEATVQLKFPKQQNEKVAADFFCRLRELSINAIENGVSN